MFESDGKVHEWLRFTPCMWLRMECYKEVLDVKDTESSKELNEK